MNEETSMKEEKRRSWEVWWEECCEGWWRNDLVDTLGWAAAFIWAGLVLLAEATDFAANFSWWDGWGVFFTGAGVIVLFETFVRLLVPKYRRKVMWSLIFGFILLGIGLGDMVSWFWPLLLITIGVIILLRIFVPRS